MPMGRSTTKNGGQSKRGGAMKAGGTPKGVEPTGGRGAKRGQETKKKGDGGKTTGTPDEYYNLISVLYHALQGAEIYEQYAEDAREAGDDELSEFFDESQRLEVERAEEAKRILMERFRSSMPAREEQRRAV